MLLHDAMRELNVAAYAAAKAARGSDLADRLKIMALDTDAMVDGMRLIVLRADLEKDGK